MRELYRSSAADPSSQSRRWSLPTGRCTISLDSATSAISRRIVGAARLHQALHVLGQLLSWEPILSGEVRVRSDRRREQPKDVTDEAQARSNCGANAGLGHGRRIVCEPPPDC